MSEPIREPKPEDAPNNVRRYLGFLAYAIAGESKAYGFTLVMWATAMLTIARHGFPSEVSILLFVLGALTGFLVAIAFAFPRLEARYHRGEEPERFAYGQLHVASVLLSIGAGWLAMRWTGSAPPAFYLSSLAAVLVYEAVLTLEIMLTTPEAGRAYAGRQRARRTEASGRQVLSFGRSKRRR